MVRANQSIHSFLVGRLNPCLSSRKQCTGCFVPAINIWVLGNRLASLKEISDSMVGVDLRNVWWCRIFFPSEKSIIQDLYVCNVVRWICGLILGVFSLHICLTVGSDRELTHHVSNCKSQRSRLHFLDFKVEIQKIYNRSKWGVFFPLKWSHRPAQLIMSTIKLRMVNQT